MSAWVYILRGSTGRHYIGSTVDLQRRLVEHDRGHTYTTRRLGSDIKLVASRECESLAEARGLERRLKSKKNPQLAIYHLNHG
jgi:putative endonuclease